MEFVTRTDFGLPQDQSTGLNSPVKCSRISGFVSLKNLYSSQRERDFGHLTTNRNGMCQSNGFQPYDNARFSHRAISITPPTRLQHASPSYTFTCFQWYTFANPANGGIDFVSKRENTRRERARFEQAGSAAPSARRFLYFSFSTFSLTT